MTKRAVLAVLVLVGLGAGVPPLAASFAAESEANEAPGSRPRVQAAMPVRVVVAELSGSYQTSNAYTGTLVAARRSRLAFERPGKIVSLVADEGALVAEGEELARLDTRRLRAQQRAVAAELLEAEAVLAELVEGPRKESIATAAAEVRSLEAQQRVAERNLQRRRLLVESAAISREEYDESYYATEVAVARVDAAKKQLEELTTGTRVERVDAQRARVDALRARLEDVGHELEDAVLTAPFAGSIARRQRDEGAIVAAGETVFELIEQSRLEAWVGLPVSAAAGLKVGDQRRVRINGAEYRATVQSLRAELDPATRTQNAVLAIDSPAAAGTGPVSESTTQAVAGRPVAGRPVAGRLVAGQVARILLEESVEEPGYWVPASALTPGRRGLWAVYVVADNETVAARDVELLHTEGERSYVRGTLQPGERVVVAGGHKIVAGQRVAVVASN